MKYGAVCQTTGKILYFYETNAELFEGPPGTTLVGLIDSDISAIETLELNNQGWVQIDSPEVGIELATDDMVWRRFNEFDNAAIELSGSYYAADYVSLNRLNHIQQSWALLGKEFIDWPDIDGAARSFNENEFSLFATEINRIKAIRTLKFQNVAARFLQHERPSVAELMNDANWLD